MKKALNWAVLGCGNIARQYSNALKNTEDAVLYACGSRDLKKAEDFAKEFGFQKAYGSYEEVYADANVDAVYIATPHPFHKEMTIAALKSGKHVLCEKPATMNAKELEEVLAVAKESGMFFMEAMWTRFQPAFSKTMEYIAAEKCGKLFNVYADICCPNPYQKGSRLYEPELGGGAALDLGIYMLTAAVSGFSAASKTPFGKCKPESFDCITRKACTGVDAFDAVIMSYKDMIANTTCSIDAGSGEVTRQAKYVCSNGTLVLDGFWYGQKIKIYDLGGNLIAEENYPHKVNGYEYEAAFVTKCILEGKKECEGHTWDDTRLLTVLADEILGNTN